MPSIHTLVPDIYDLIRKKDTGWFHEQLARDFSADLAKRLRGQLGQGPQKATLRLSGMGAKCPRALWYSIHHPERAEALPPWAEIKYSFGHILEALVITLAKAAGHEVTGEQDEIILDGIVGHRDCVIDGCTVDVKSSSSLSFNKFRSRDFSATDSFGYLDQLDGYVVGSSGDPLVRVTDKGYILAIDKQLGHMALYEHTVRPDSIRNRIALYKTIANSKSPPGCTCRTGTFGASGNEHLMFPATYNAYKFCCFPHLRVFRYGEGHKAYPEYLTKVVKLPTVPEITQRYRQFGTVIV